MPPTLTDLYLAFRQAKVALYFERRGVGLSQLADFEADLDARLSTLHEVLAGNGGWFDGIELGAVWVVPKKSRTREGAASSNTITRIGGAAARTAGQGLDVQIRMSPTPEFAIVEVLYLWRFGPALDAMLSRNAVGYRLDVRKGQLDRTRRWLFEHWPKRYQEFRSVPIRVATNALQRGGQVVIVGADLAAFYDTIDASFMVAEPFVRTLEVQASPESVFAPAEYRRATRSLLDAYGRFQSAASGITGLDWRTGIPIGALTSRVVANLSLATLDAAIATQPNLICYRRYVDDIVIVGRSAGETASFDDTLFRYLPHASSADGVFKLNVDALGRAGCDFELQRSKIRIHELRGLEGLDFLQAVESDFRELVSEQRAFIDTTVLLEDVATQLVRTGKREGTPIRVLRDADRSKLQHFAAGTVLRSLERVSVLTSTKTAQEIAGRTLEGIRRFLSGDADWVENLEIAFRLLKLGATTRDDVETTKLNAWMDATWGTIAALESVVGSMYHRGRLVEGKRAWIWLRNYLHERRLEAVAAALPAPVVAKSLPAWLRAGLRYRTTVVRPLAVARLARALAGADLRVRDHEDDNFSELEPDVGGSAPSYEPELLARFQTIDLFAKKCRALGDAPWSLHPSRLFLCTRPPSYFDIARRWLYRSEADGFAPTVFEDLLGVVNAVRGTNYWDPVGRVLNEATVVIPSDADGVGAGSKDPRLILGNLTVPESAFAGAATRIVGSRTGRPELTRRRLRGLATVLAQAERLATQPDARGRASLLVLPELSLPRAWFRAVANHVVRSGTVGLVVGLEYLHDPVRPLVTNQVHAVLPGPYGSVATWPWTKRLPAREEANELGKLRVPVSFRPLRPPAVRRTVVQGPYGRFSVLICSELIEAERVADLLGRVELVLAPSWNRDTSSYDHLIQSVGLQLHAIVAVANNGHYSDSRAWAPRTARWQRDLCRLVERDADGVVFVDMPLRSLRAFHLSGGAISVERSRKNPRPAEWRPLPPWWPREAAQ